MKINHLIQIIGIYLVIGLSGYLSWQYVPIQNEILAFATADVVMTIVCFVFSILKKNSSVYDAYWSVIPFYFVLLWARIYFENLTIFHYLTFTVISIWSWRLTLNWVRWWSGFAHEDWRYINLRKKTGVFYPVVNFLGIQLFPTAMVFAGMWPLFFMFSSSGNPSWLFYVGVVICLFGIALEFFADNQLAAFRKRPNPKTEDLLDTGIWAYSRNPNYLGEILFWVGLFFIGFSFGAPWYTVAGVFIMIGLFTFISIPMKEKHMTQRRPAFKEYKKRVPLFIPRF